MAIVTHDVICISALDIPLNIVGAIVPLPQISMKTMAALLTGTYAILSSLTILVTGLIAVRLLLVRRQHKKVMGK